MIELTRHGKRVAVLLSTDEYDRLTSRRPDFWEAYESFRQRYDLKTLGIEPDEFLAGVRDPDPGRDPHL